MALNKIELFIKNLKILHTIACYQRKRATKRHTTMTTRAKEHLLLVMSSSRQLSVSQSAATRHRLSVTP
jgi:hypothetical protein